MKYCCYILFFIASLFLYVEAHAGVNDWCNSFFSDLSKSDSLVVKKITQDIIVIAPATHKGYVVLSNTNPRRLVAYSNESYWNEEGFPPDLINWITTYSKSNCSGNCQSRSINVKDQRQSVQPLVTTKWHQNAPFNDYAPVITDGNVKTVAGCVAIAAAQITYYWWRDNPECTQINTPIYPYGGAPVTYSVPKGTPNDWDMIKNEYTEDDTPESRDAVARLCYVLGTTSYLNYASSTGGSINDAKNAMRLQYNLVSADCLNKSICESGEWESILYKELACGRPVMCSGVGSGGHAFVLDGYDSETGLFHINFGWGGSGDGYYPVDDSESSMGGYYMNQSLVYNIHPLNRNLKAEIQCELMSNDCCKIIINTINNGTLPAQLRLIAYKNKEKETEESKLLWEYSIENDNMLSSFELVVNNSNILDCTSMCLIDEYNSEICSYDIFPSSIDILDLSEEKTNSIVYGLDGAKLQSIIGSNLNIVTNCNGRKIVFVR